MAIPRNTNGFCSYIFFSRCYEQDDWPVIFMEEGNVNTTPYGLRSEVKKLYLPKYNRSSRLRHVELLYNEDSGNEDLIDVNYKELYIRVESYNTRIYHDIS